MGGVLAERGTPGQTKELSPSFCLPPQGGPFGHAPTAPRTELLPRSCDTCYPKTLRPTPAHPPGSDGAGLPQWSLMFQATHISSVLPVLPQLPDGPAANYHTPKGTKRDLQTLVPIHGSHSLEALGVTHPLLDLLLDSMINLTLGTVLVIPKGHHSLQAAEQSLLGDRDSDPLQARILLPCSPSRIPVPTGPLAPPG